MANLTQNDQGIFHRAGTFDEYILREVKCYAPYDYTGNDIILDIGGHIGAFASHAAQTGASVISYEPEPGNYEVLEKNAEAFNFQAVRAAIIGGDESEISFYINEKKNNALHSIEPIKGRKVLTVPAVKFSEVLDTVQPNIIKCDCEGGEYYLDWYELANRPTITKVIMELHLTKKAWRQSDAPAIVKLFEDLGFTAVHQPMINPKNWTTLAIWRRN